MWHAFDLLADIGIVALLFRIGLESHPSALAEKLPRASLIWLGNMAIAGAAGFVAARYLLDFGLIPSLLVATALTATSVGVSISPWEDRGLLQSSDGQLLIDVAELDDIAGVALMAMLLAAVPVLLNGSGSVLPAVGVALGLFAAKLAFFVALCLMFTQFMEARVMSLAARLGDPPDQMLVVVGLGFVIASIAGWLGFPLAVGALFAGLLFSRDPRAIKTEGSFQGVYAFVTPFFFIWIGMQVTLPSLVSGLWIGLALSGAAIAGKVIGTWLPARVVTSPRGALLMSASMVPRAEIAMVIVHQGSLLGPAVVSETLFAGMVLVVLVTCVGPPILLSSWLGRWENEVRNGSA